MNCRECKGRGWVRVPAECGKAASMCCGGCEKDETCFVCDGVGELDRNDMDLDSLELIEIHDTLCNHVGIDKKLLEALYEQINDIELNRRLL
jgi:hypothetical protein